jgi:hypothetical protein
VLIVRIMDGMDAAAAAPTTNSPRRPRRILRYAWLLLFVLPIAVSTAIYAASTRPDRYYEARWSSTGLLPPAASDPEPRVLVFAARTGSWRSIFAVHSWIVVKPRNGPYTRYEVTGFGEPVRVNRIAPDAYWFSYSPEILGDLRGDLAEQAIPKIEEAVHNYAYVKRGDYRIWPGPNSNTFIATVLRAAPELQVALPPTAIGKDFRADDTLFGLTPSGTGVEASLFGLLGVKAGWVEGIEVNVLTLVAGLDLRHPAIKLPGLGRIGVFDFSASALTR